MSLDKLAKRLKRDVRRSPKKAVALGLLCLVALWFWLPLLWGWVAPEQTASAESSGKEQSARRGPGGAPAEFNPTAAASTSPEESRPPPQTWRTVLEQINGDSRTQPARLDTPAPGPATALIEQVLPWSPLPAQAGRDPFTRPQAPEPIESPGEIQESKEPQEPTEPPDLAPETLGARVTSTVATAGGRGVAVVNGTVLRPGEPVDLGGGETSYRFRLTEVHGWGAILTRRGKRYRLEIPLYRQGSAPPGTNARHGDTEDTPGSTKSEPRRPKQRRKTHD